MPNLVKKYSTKITESDFHNNVRCTSTDSNISVVTLSEIVISPMHKGDKNICKQQKIHQKPKSVNPGLSLVMITLLSCGDVHPQPGPMQGKRTPSDPCVVCERGVIASSKAVSCDMCNKWTHIRCTSSVSKEQYDRLVNSQEHFSFVCVKCNSSYTSTNCSNSDTSTKPTRGRETCLHCDKGFNYRSKFITCNRCSQRVHSRCLGLAKDQSDILVNAQNQSFVCNYCNMEDLPFLCEDYPEDDPEIDQDLPTDSEDNFQCFSRKGLHFIHLNVRSLVHKLEQIKRIAELSKATVMCFTETWLDESVSDSEINIPGYNVVRNDRSTHGGGVCMYIRTNISFNHRPNLNDPNLEAVWCELHLKKTKPIIAGCCYRPPRQKRAWRY